MASQKWKKKSVYICIEIKNRELESNLLLVDKLINKGYRCYVGSNHAIFKLVSSKKIKAGIYLDKSTQPLNITKSIRTKVDYLLVLDHELSPIMGEDRVKRILQTRLYPGSAELVDKFIVPGPIIAKQFEKHFPHDKILKSGWPKADLWSVKSAELYRTVTQNLTSKYKEFYLFASNLVDIKNPELERNSTFIREGEVNFGRKEIFELRMIRYKNFQNLLKIFNNWDKNLGSSKILVRPHPAEDVRVWRKKLKNMSNIFLDESGGDISPFIHACEGFLHVGSTTSLQAILSGKRVFFLPEVSVSSLDKVADEISPYIVTLDKPPTRDIEKLKHMNNPNYRRDVIKELLYVHPNTSTLCLVDEIESLKVNSEYAMNRLRLYRSRLSLSTLKRVVSVILHEIKWFVRLTDIRPPSDKLQGRISRQNIEDFPTYLGRDNNYLIKNLARNLWTIEKDGNR